LCTATIYPGVLTDLQLASKRQIGQMMMFDAAVVYIELEPGTGQRIWENKNGFGEILLLRYNLR
jgi:uncharacterized membrane protein YcaP (DUF421 family)